MRMSPLRSQASPAHWGASCETTLRSRGGDGVDTDGRDRCKRTHLRGMQRWTRSQLVACTFQRFAPTQVIDGITHSRLGCTMQPTSARHRVGGVLRRQDQVGCRHIFKDEVLDELGGLDRRGIPDGRLLWVRARQAGNTESSRSRPQQRPAQSASAFRLFQPPTRAHSAKAPLTSCAEATCADFMDVESELLAASSTTYERLGVSGERNAPPSTGARTQREA